MSPDHPITPPRELVRSIVEEGQMCNEMIRLAYAAGADMELEACCEWLSFYSAVSDARNLRGARRPKPPSLKEQALEALGRSPGEHHAVMIDHAQYDAILAALEALPDE